MKIFVSNFSFHFFPSDGRSQRCKFQEGVIIVANMQEYVGNPNTIKPHLHCAMDHLTLFVSNVKHHVVVTR